MTQYDRTRMTALYKLFRIAALEDQRNYYKYMVNRYRKAASQVNRLRAFFALLTGLASASAGLIVQKAISNGTLTSCKTNQLVVFAQQSAVDRPESTAQPPASSVSSSPNQTAPELIVDCVGPNIVVPILLIVAIAAPALGGVFTTLADLYQWDRTITIYDSAIENLEVADAQAPLDSMESDIEYRAALRAFAEGTLTVMRDETSQWGQLIKTPASLEKFVAEETKKADQSTIVLGNKKPDAT